MLVGLYDVGTRSKETCLYLGVGAPISEHQVTHGAGVEAVESKPEEQCLQEQAPHQHPVQLWLCFLAYTRGA